MGVIMIVTGYNEHYKNCPEPIIEYRYIPRSFYDEQVSNVNLNNWLNRQDNIWMLRSKALNYMIKLVTKGITDEYRSLGAFYVLMALTLSSNEAAIAMPWLYQSAI